MFCLFVRFWQDSNSTPAAVMKCRMIDVEEPAVQQTGRQVAAEPRPSRGHQRRRGAPCCRPPDEESHWFLTRSGDTFQPLVRVIRQNRGRLVGRTMYPTGNTAAFPTFPVPQQNIHNNSSRPSADSVGQISGAGVLFHSRRTSARS